MSISRQEDQRMMFHPHNVLLTVLLAGLTMLFLALTVAYVYTRVTKGLQPIEVPVLFYVNTLVLVLSSYTMTLAKKAYLADDTKGYQNRLLQTIGLTLVFIALQALAWTWLFRVNAVTLQSSVGAAYLYVISFVHFAHVWGGLPFLYLFWRKARKEMKDPVTVLVYFSDPEKRLKLRLLTLYWHFLDGLWIYLALFLAINRFLAF